MATHPDIKSLRALVKRDQEFFHIQSQRLAEIQQSDPETLSDADKNSISSWDKSVIKDCNRQLMMLEEIPAPTVEEREIMQELNKLITLGDHIMEKRNLVHAELNDRLNAMKKSHAAKSKPLNKDDTEKPASVPTPSTEEESSPVNDQALGSADLSPPDTAVPSTTPPTTAQSSTMVEEHACETDEMQTLTEDDTVAFDPKDLYAIMKIDPETETPLVKKAARKATLLLHPDRNPDDPNAASKFADFQAVCRVFESDEARKEFDETGNVEEIKDLRQRLRGLTLEK